MTEGYIYCFYNTLFPNLLKIGMTERTPLERLHEANSCTWVPKPFELKLAKKVINPIEKERKLHILLQKFNMRINNNREFFEISIDDAKLFLDLLEGEYYEVENINSSIINSSFSNLFLEGQKIRHKARCTQDIWIGIYKENKDAIIHNEIEYSSLSAFAGAHYKEVRNDRGTSANGWEECEVYNEDTWIKASIFRSQAN